MGKQYKIGYSLDRKSLFVNPYNFVSSDFSLAKSTADNDNKKISGSITCSLVTKTPLAILDTAHQETVEINNGSDKHSIISFFKAANGRPMIPASSIRGPVRNVYETVTNSCYATQKESGRILSARSLIKPGQPGILVKKAEKWVLYKATAGKFKPEEGINECVRTGKAEGVDEGQVITHSVKTIGQGTETTMTGMLVIGEAFDNKRNVYIFEKGEQTVSSRGASIDELVDRLKTNITDYYRNVDVNIKYDPANVDSIGKTHRGYRRYLEFLERGEAPVWYRENGKDATYVTLSPACIGRIVYHHTEADLLGNKNRCTNREECCRACDLFGMIGVKEQSQCSKVRFTDAACIGTQKVNTAFYRLRELAGPKDSYFPFYLKSDKPDEYYVTPDSKDVSIRGRKFYWHSQNADELNVKLENKYDGKNENIIERTKRNSTVETVAPGTEFTFSVYFNRITEAQLKELIWALTFWDNKKDGDMCYKIGHGKPVGLGSVKISVSNIDIRSYDNGNYMVESRHFEDYSQENPFAEEALSTDNTNHASSRTIRELLAIVDFRNCMNVDYPSIIAESELEELLLNSSAEEDRNALTSHQWFSENKKKAGKGDYQPLPTILDEFDSFDAERLKMKKFKAYKTSKP